MAKLSMENSRLRRMIWIVRQLQRQDLTLKELNERYKLDDNVNCGEDAIERRTFLNYLHAISDLFQIDIECDRRNEFKYHIECDGMQPVVSHMIANFEQNIALGESMRLKDRIVVEQAPGGHEYLEPIMEAMEKERNITITFQDFNIEGPFDVTGAPYCLKLYQNRWYVAIKEEKNDEGVPWMDTYCLDRITHLRMEKTKFRMDPTFNAEEYFKYSFGVRVIPDEKPMLIRLKVAAVQRGYLRSLPLHPSQQEVETKRTYSIFTLEVVPTIELMLKILSYGFLIEVLSPDDFRDAVKENVEKTYRMYFK